MKKGTHSSLYRKYLPFFEEFLQTYAHHDIDGDGKLWCSKEEWVDFLCTKINDDDGNAVAHAYCQPTYAENGYLAATAAEMLLLVRRGKEYICHRLYNMGFLSDIERRRNGRNVAYFRRTIDGEKLTPPSPDAVYLLKNIFKNAPTRSAGTIHRLTPDEACNRLLLCLNSKIFRTQEQKLKEWRRVRDILLKQGFIQLKQGYYEFNPKER